MKRPRVSLACLPALLRIILNRASLAKGSQPEGDLDSKKPRRSERLSHHGADKTPVSHSQQLPSPLTHMATEDSAELEKSPTVTPPEGRPSQAPRRRTEDAYSQAYAFSSPPQDTQAFSQAIDPHTALSDEVEDEVKEGVWGYLFPLDAKHGGRAHVLKKRTACPLPESLLGINASNSTVDRKGKSPLLKDEEAYERTKINSIASGGYLIGRHLECGMFCEPTNCYPRRMLTRIPSRHRHRRSYCFQSPLSNVYRKQGYRYCCRARGPV